MRRNKQHLSGRERPGTDPRCFGTNGWRRFLLSEDGLTITEYAVAAGLIAASLTVTFGNLGTTIDSIIIAVIAFM